MATTRQRRAGANPPNYAIDEDGDRVYTEDDYAAPESTAALPDEWEAEHAYPAAGWTGEEYLPDEAFTPDEEDIPAVDSWSAEDGNESYAPVAAEDGYFPLFDEEMGFDEDLDPLSEELLSDEEQAELKRSHWQLISGLADFAGVILGTAAILILVMLLVSLINWLVNDMNQSFILLQKNL